MVRITCSCDISGARFYPSELEIHIRLKLDRKLEPGEIATYGRYRGQPRPYGSAQIAFEGPAWCDEPALHQWLLDIKSNLQAFRDAGADDIYLDFLVAYNGQCNLGADAEFFLLLGSIGLPVTMTCWVDETLPM